MTYDYVVLGAGAAGCVLAARLTMDPRVSVLLVERGGASRDPRLAIPRAFLYTMRSPRHSLRYPTEAGPGVPQEFWLRGQGLGGSTLINGLMYVRGDEAGFHDLETSAGPGWGAADFDRAYQEMESGPLDITIPSAGDEVSGTIIDAATSLGLRRVGDFNAAGGDRIAYTPATALRGRRVSAASAFLRSIGHRPNLTIATRQIVERVELANGRAVGAILRSASGVRQTVLARREVIVAAGALESPGILERSGIGSTEVLRAAGIEPRVENPRVGEGLVEHRGVSLQVRFRDRRGITERLNTRSRQTKEGLRYLATRRGPIATSGYDVVSAFAVQATSEAPDAQGVWVPIAIDQNAQDLRPAPYSGLLFTGYAIRPTSAGSVHVRSADPRVTPRIVPRYLEDESEQRTTAGILEHARDVIAASGLAQHVVEEVFPGQDMTSAEDVINHARAHGGGIYHAVGSCGMSRDAGSVVDDELRVRGVERLRVIDASVYPHHVSGNTAAPVMALAWLAADRMR